MGSHPAQRARRLTALGSSVAYLGATGVIAASAALAADEEIVAADIPTSQTTAAQLALDLSGSAEPVTTAARVRRLSETTDGTSTTLADVGSPTSSPSPTAAPTTARPVTTTAGTTAAPTTAAPTTTVATTSSSTAAPTTTQGTSTSAGPTTSSTTAAPTTTTTAAPTTTTTAAPTTTLPPTTDTTSGAS